MGKVIHAVEDGDLALISLNRHILPIDEKNATEPGAILPCDVCDMREPCDDVHCPTVCSASMNAFLVP